MKLRNLAALPLIMISAVAFADDDHYQMPANTMPLSSIIQHVQTEGYKNINDIEWEHGVYEVKVFDQYGREFKLAVNPQTGAVLNKQTESPVSISMEQAAVAIEKAGYSKISELEIKRHGYKAKAFDAQGNRVRLHVDAATGAVTKRDSWFD